MEDEDKTFRPAVAEDIKSMWEIDQSCFDAETAYGVDIFYFHLLVNRDPSFVAQDKDRNIVGFVMTSVEGRGTGQIVTIDVVKEWRGKGIGKGLMTLAEMALRERGMKRIVLQTAVENVVAIRFYEKLGYKQKPKRILNYYGEGKHAYVYEKLQPSSRQ